MVDFHNGKISKDLNGSLRANKKKVTITNVNADGSYTQHITETSSTGYDKGLTVYDLKGEKGGNSMSYFQSNEMNPKFWEIVAKLATLNNKELDDVYDLVRIIEKDKPSRQPRTSTLFYNGPRDMSSIENMKNDGLPNMAFDPMNLIDDQYSPNGEPIPASRDMVEEDIERGIEDALGPIEDDPLPFDDDKHNPFKEDHKHYNRKKLDRKDKKHRNHNSAGSDDNNDSD